MCSKFSCKDNMLRLKTSSPDPNGPIFTQDELSLDRLSSQPKVMDPMEQRNVYVKDTNHGEGLFAKRDIGPDQVVAYYGGILLLSKLDSSKFTNLTREEIERTNAYKLPLNASHMLDVPGGSLIEFRSSLGHKANHAFQANTRFLQVLSPR